MKINKMTIQNFMSIRRVELTINDLGLILVTGENKDDGSFKSNGSGKSTIFEAITYTIYGKTLRGLSTSEVVNNKVNKNMCIFMDCEDEKGISYRIARYGAHKEHKNQVYVYRDGKNITPKSIKDTNVFIEKLFGMDFKTFSNSVMFGGSEKTFTNSTDAEKKQILENMLDLIVWSDAQKLAKERLKTVKDEILSASSESSYLGNMEQETRNTLDSFMKLKEDDKKEREDKVKELEEKLRKIEDDSKEVLANCDEQLDKLEGEISLLDGQSKKLDESLEESLQLQKHLKGKVSKINSVYQSIVDCKGEYNITEKQLESLTNELNKIDEKLDGDNYIICPSCGEKIIDNLDELKEQQTQKEDEISTCVYKLAKLKKQINKLLKQYKKLEEYDDALEEVIESIQTLKTDKQKTASLIERKQEKVKDILDLMNNYSIDEKREEIFKEIDALRGANSKYDTLIRREEEKLNNFIEEKESYDEMVEELKSKQEKLEFGVKAFSNSGIKSYLLDTVTPILNQRANEYLRKLSGTTMEIRFTTQKKLKNGDVKEQFDIEVLNNVGGDSYKKNSKGEKRRIDLAISLALQDLVLERSNAKLNLLMYDEVFDGLDDIGAENVITLLKEIQGKVGSILVITHNDNLKSFFDKEMKVIKENGETTLRMEG